MKKIINTDTIIKAGINREHYFLSLITLLNKYGRLQDYEVEKIQYDALEILRSEVQRYTLGESSSVRVEAAESIFLSIQYILGLYFNNIDDLDKSIDVLRKGKLGEAYTEGRKILDALFEKTKFLMNKVECNKIVTNNYAYNDTVEYGLPLFFKLYDKKFAAHEIPGSIDYRLTEGDLVYLKSLIPSWNREKATEAIQRLMLDLEINDNEMAEYISEDLDKLISRINITAELDKLNTIFIIDKEREGEEPIAFIDSEKMSNDDFRDVYQEVIECNDVKGKIQIIRENIRSLEDLVDILDSECIYGDEYIEVFNELSDEELALIMKFIMLPLEESKFDIIDKEWQVQLFNYINKTHTSRKENIINIYERII